MGFVDPPFGSVVKSSVSKPLSSPYQAYLGILWLGALLAQYAIHGLSSELRAIDVQLSRWNC